MVLEGFLGDLLRWLSALWEIIKTVGGVSLLFALLFLLCYLKYPEGTVHAVLYLVKLAGYFNRRVAKFFVSRDLRLLLSSKIAEEYSIHVIPEVRIEWSDVEKAKLLLERNVLIINLRGVGRHEENIAKALILAIPHLLGYEAPVVLDKNLVLSVSAHIARKVARNKPAIVSAINEVVESELKNEYRPIGEKIVEIDDQSLLSRVFIPKMLECARLRYPDKDPRLSEELRELLETLYEIARGEASLPLICGKYLRAVFIRVAKPETIEAGLEPYLRFLESALKKCKGLEEVYLLAAGVNIVVAELLRDLIVKKFRVSLSNVEEHRYTGTYRGARGMKLYVCRVRIA